MTVANRSPAPTVQNLPDNRASMSLISRSSTPTTPFGGFGINLANGRLTFSWHIHCIQTLCQHLILLQLDEALHSLLTAAECSALSTQPKSQSQGPRYTRPSGTVLPMPVGLRFSPCREAYSLRLGSDRTAPTISSFGLPQNPSRIRRITHRSQPRESRTSDRRYRGLVHPSWC